jgi:small subunit ribosomal protein S20
LPVRKKSPSVLKRQRSNERKALYRGMVRNSTRTYVKKARSLVEARQLDSATEAIEVAISALDRAASKGVIHRNNAARRKSRLMKALNRAKQEAAAG